MSFTDDILRRDLFTTTIYTAYVSDDTMTSKTPSVLSADPSEVWFRRAIPPNASAMEMTVAGVTFSLNSSAIITATITG